MVVRLLVLAGLLALWGCDSGAAGDLDGEIAAAATDVAELAGDVEVAAGPDAAVEVAADAAPETTPDADVAAPLPAVTGDGPYRVGYRELEITYTPETFEQPRTLKVAVWYPTDATTGEGSAYLLLADRPDVLRDAAPRGTEPYPVLFFSHGNRSIAQQSWFLTERLASHGWLVIAPAHTGNTMFGYDFWLDPIMFLLRPLDIRATLDAMLALPESDPLAGRLSERIALAGHSFGGFTTLVLGGARLNVDYLDLLCPVALVGGCIHWTEPRRQLALAGLRDERFGALIPMAPSSTGGILGSGATAPITAPTLMLTAGLDLTTPGLTNADPLWAGLEGPQHLRVELPTAGHFTFSNGCELGIGVGDGCGLAYIAPEDAFHITNAFTLAWLRYHLQGDTSVLPLLVGETPLADGLTLSRPSATEGQ